MSESRHTVTISLPSEQMEFIKNNSDSVSKFMQELVAKKMVEFDPFSEHNSYKNTARELMSKCVSIGTLFLEDYTFDKLEQVQTTLNATPKGYEIVVSKRMEFAPYKNERIMATFRIGKDTGKIDFACTWNKTKLGECIFVISVERGDELYTKVMQFLSQYIAKINANI
ncbi:MAG: hypothetical protein MJZ34_15415 [Paludibacteraceae bacterium]|nr:hypothetical protein [Paludibacteraceae bacterium]